MMHYELTLDEARAASRAAGFSGWIDPSDFLELPARAAACRTGDAHAKVVRDWAKVDCPLCHHRAKGAPLHVKAAFTHDFGAGAGNLTVDVPAGAAVHWHRENAQWYVVPGALPAFARHDAEYRGVPVRTDNLEA